MIVLDTTILVYAKGAEHPVRQRCRDLLEAIQIGDVRATTTVEVIQEFAHVRTRRRDRTDATELATGFVELLAPLLPVSEANLRRGLRLFEAYSELGAFDAVLAATAIDAGAEALISADRSFAAVPDLIHVDPATPAIDEWLPG